MREIDGILYCNDGDWVESHTALVEHMDGRLAVSYTHLRAHETVLDLVCRLLLEKKKQTNTVARMNVGKVQGQISTRHEVCQTQELII